MWKDHRPVLRVLSGSLHTFNNLRTFCQSFAVLHSIRTRRVGRTVCTWMSCTMSGNFDFYSPFIIRCLAPRAKCWQQLLFVFCRIFLCFSPLFVFVCCIFLCFFSRICPPPLSHSNRTVWKVFAHFVCFVSFCTQHIQSIPFFRTPVNGPKTLFCFWASQKLSFDVCFCFFMLIFFLYWYLFSISLLSV